MKTYVKPRETWLTMGIFNKMIGNMGERFAIEYLNSKGFHVKSTKYSTKFAEIDIIAEKADTLYIFEVKSVFRDYPHENTIFAPEDKININKIRKLRRFAEFYANKENFTGKIDIGIVVVELLKKHKKGHTVRIIWY